MIHSSLLTRTMQTNQSDYNRAVSYEHAIEMVATSYQAGIEQGNSMSQVWLEERETSIIAGKKGVVIVEFHNASASNQGRSHVQVIRPSPRHVLRIDDQV